MEKSVIITLLKGLFKTAFFKLNFLYNELDKDAKISLITVMI